MTGGLKKEAHYMSKQLQRLFASNDVQNIQATQKKKKRVKIKGSPELNEMFLCIPRFENLAL